MQPARAIAVCPYGLFGVLSRKIISPGFGIAVVVLVTRFHCVPTKGAPVSHPFRAEPPNVDIG